MRQRFELVWVILSLLALPTPAYATPYVLDSLADANIGIELRATDGFTLAAQAVTVDNFEMGAEADLVGTLNPVVSINEIWIRLPPVTFEFSLGASAVPATLTISARWSFNILDPIQLNSSSGASAPLMSFGAAGILETFDGASLPFNLHMSDWSGSGDGRLEERLNNSQLGEIGIRSSADGLTLTLSPGNSSVGQVRGKVFARPIGSSGGLDYMVTLRGVSFLEAQLVADSSIPEPSTALLLGLGLIGIAVGRKVA